MDSNDQERERGITILAKAASVTWKGTRINLVDTPGHADFGGEVERALAMVDGVLLLVDAAEGPLPQTRYVLSKALARRPADRRRAEQGRPRATPGPTRCSTRSTSCSSTSAPRTSDIEFPIISAVAREGRAVAGIGNPGPDDDLTALLDAILATVPAPVGDPDGAAAGARHEPRRVRLPRPPRHRPRRAGHAAQGRAGRAARRGGRRGPAAADAPAHPAAWASRASAGSTSTSAVAGDLFVIAGFPEVEIGDTLADPAAARGAAPAERRRAGAAHDLRRQHLAAGRQGRAGTSPRATSRSASTARCSATCRSGVEDTDSPDVHRGGRPRRAAARRAHRDRCAARATSSRSAGPR